MFKLLIAFAFGVIMAGSIQEGVADFMAAHDAGPVPSKTEGLCDD